MTKKMTLDRRNFLKQAAGAVGAAGAVAQAQHWSGAKAAEESGSGAKPSTGSEEVSYPRRFAGRHLKMISFPLGGVAAGSLGLGGRGQLTDWEIFNRPNKESCGQCMDCPSSD